jgi:hypothetical protein
MKEIQSLLGKRTAETETQQLEFEFNQSEEFFFQFSQKTKSVENNLSTFKEKPTQKFGKKYPFNSR